MFFLYWLYNKMIVKKLVISKTYNRFTKNKKQKKENISIIQKKIITSQKEKQKDNEKDKNIKSTGKQGLKWQ